VFAKEFFMIIDIHNNGNLSLDEISMPLISLGLSSDIGFVKNLLKAINPKKFSSEKLQSIV
jgi:hypothetical protein